MSRCGISNTSGNDCFLNAAMQCLAVSPFIQEFLKRYTAEDNKLFKIINRFGLGKFKADTIKDECIKILTTQSSVLTPDDIRILSHLKEHSADIFIYIVFRDFITNLNSKPTKIIKNISFITILKELTNGSYASQLFNGEQNDPHEFLTYLLDKLHNSKKASIKIDLPANIDELEIFNKMYFNHLKTKYENNYSYFVKNFYYYTLNCVECSKCKLKTHDVCPSDIICVAIPPDLHKVTIHDCLDEMFNVKPIDYKCESETCKNTKDNRIEKKILSKPKTFIITIKRYSQVNGRLLKNNKMVYYPEILNMQNYLCSEGSYKYVLYAIINHTGSLNSGHYYSYVRPQLTNNQWLCCNDANVSIIQEDEVFSSQNAYMLFYINILE